jgi:hypothetical protein
MNNGTNETQDFWKATYLTVIQRGDSDIIAQQEAEKAATHFRQAFFESKDMKIYRLLGDKNGDVRLKTVEDHSLSFLDSHINMALQDPLTEVRKAALNRPDIRFTQGLVNGLVSSDDLNNVNILPTLFEKTTFNAEQMNHIIQDPLKKKVLSETFPEKFQSNLEKILSLNVGSPSDALENAFNDKVVFNPIPPSRCPPFRR